MAQRPVRPHLLRKILAFNILVSGTFVMRVGLGQRDGTIDPVPQAIVLTGIVVAIVATALARQLLDLGGAMRLPEDRDEPERDDDRRAAYKPDSASAWR